MSTPQRILFRCCYLLTLFFAHPTAELARLFRLLVRAPASWLPLTTPAALAVFCLWAPTRLLAKGAFAAAVLVAGEHGIG